MEEENPIKPFIFIFTFPGIIFHEFSHKIFCDILKIKVYEVEYLHFSEYDDEIGSVSHAPIFSFYKSLLVCIAPLILGTILFFILMCLFKINAFPSIKFLHYTIKIVILWLATAIAYHSFPSKTDGINIINTAKLENNNLFNKSLGYLIGGVISVITLIPLYGLIYTLFIIYFFYHF